MNLPEQDIIQRIESLMQSSHSFALYRLPWTDECILVLQTKDEAEILTDITQLNGKQGFVIAPFRLSEDHPLMLIRPDILASGWEAISKALSYEEENVTLHSVKRHFTNAKTTLYERPPQEGLEGYREVFTRFITPLQKKTFQKLVLSRMETCTLTEGFSPLRAFVKACNSYPRMMIYLCHTPQTGTWLGSTPEILLSGQEKNWHTVALAGTMPMQGEVMPEEWSDKNKEEQKLVAEYVRRIVKKFGNKLEEQGPYTARAGQLVHLKSDFRFNLKNKKSLGNLLKELHPTPAVCGLPKEETYRFIAENEGYERKYYSGFIGWLDSEGQTDLYVNLRCMEINDGKATLYAGGGILPSSEMALEYEETKEKMKTMKNIL